MKCRPLLASTSSLLERQTRAFSLSFSASPLTRGSGGAGAYRSDCQRVNIHRHIHPCMHAYMYAYIHIYIRLNPWRFSLLPSPLTRGPGGAGAHRSEGQWVDIHRYIHTCMHACMHIYAGDNFKAAQGMAAPLGSMEMKHGGGVGIHIYMHACIHIYPYMHIYTYALTRGECNRLLSRVLTFWVNPILLSQHALLRAPTLFLNFRVNPKVYETESPRHIKG